MVGKPTGPGKLKAGVVHGLGENVLWVCMHRNPGYGIWRLEAVTYPRRRPIFSDPISF